MPIYVPKKIVPLTPTEAAPLFFLAGPIRGGGDWQALMARNIIGRNPYCHIACPSRWTAEHELGHYLEQPFYEDATTPRQRRWEEHYLDQAALEEAPGCVIFWLGLESETDPHPGPEPYGMDTRRELGMLSAYVKFRPQTRVVIGGHPDFFGLSTILDSFAQSSGRDDFPFYETMSETVEVAFTIALGHA